MHEQTFNAASYHLNKSEQTGYVTAEALQFACGPEIFQGVAKVGSVLRGLGAGVQKMTNLGSKSEKGAEVVWKGTKTDTQGGEAAGVKTAQRR